MSIAPRWIVCATVLACAAPLAGEDVPERAAGLTPEKAAAAMAVPPGFAVELVAGEPVVHQPIAFTIDERGRLWVAEAFTYPIRAPEGEGRDKIIILEDTDGNGSFETRKVFAENLNLVSGLEVGFGGVWVGAAPYLMFIADRDRDDQPDGPPEVVLDGWGYDDTHETLNSFTWGPDGWLYGCHGVFTHSRVGKPGAPDDRRIPLNAGVWRFHPIGREFEVFAHGTSNPWGIDFNDHGQAFITACVIPHLYHVIQGGRYERQAGQHFESYTYEDIKTIADHLHYTGKIADHAWWGRDAAANNSAVGAAGGGHAHCGAMVYLGDTWPDEYRNTVFMFNVHGNRANNDTLERRGSGYVARHGKDFLLANDPWFRGISLKYGPDGGVYLIDWYDRNACHRIDPQVWDRSNGRIYKVTYGRPKPTQVDLAKLPDHDLVRLQLHKNDWYVRVARRVLQERAAAGKLGPKTREELLRIFSVNPDTTRKLRALWALHATAGLTNADRLAMLDHPDEHVRAWAVQLEMEDRATPRPFAERVVSLAASETSPVVRLYIAAALQRMAVDERWQPVQALLAHAEDAADHNIPLMLWYGVEPLVGADPARAMDLIRSSKVPLVSRLMTRRAASEPGGLDAVLSAMMDVPAGEQKLMLEEVAQAVAARAALKMPASWPALYARLVESGDGAVRDQADFITVKFGDRSVFPALRRIVADGDAPGDRRLAALQSLLAGRDPELPPILHRLLGDAAVRGAAIRGLATFDHAQTPKAILGQYAQLSASERADAVATLASRPPYALALLEAIAAGVVPRGDISAFNARQMLQLGDPAVEAQLQKVWGTIRSAAQDKAKLMEEYRGRLTPEALAKADLSHGRLLYNRTCAACHKLYGQGGDIGPDLTGANRGDMAYLLENILDPSAIVGRDYQLTMIQMSDGRTIAGMIKSENDSALTVQLANEQTVVPRSAITKIEPLPVSMMPEGQLAALAEHDAVNLIAYLMGPSQAPLPGEPPAADPTTGRVPSAIEGESVKVLAKSGGNPRAQQMGGFLKGKWSGDAQLWWTGAKPGDRLTLEFSVPAQGSYWLHAAMTKAQDYAIVELYLDDQPLGEPLDLYNPVVTSSGPIPLGRHQLSAGVHRLSVEIVGHNPQAKKNYMFGLDYFHPAREE